MTATLEKRADKAFSMPRPSTDFDVSGWIQRDLMRLMLELDAGNTNYPMAIAGIGKELLELLRLELDRRGGQENSRKTLRRPHTFTPSKWCGASLTQSLAMLNDSIDSCERAPLVRETMKQLRDVCLYEIHQRLIDDFPA